MDSTRAIGSSWVCCAPLGCCKSLGASTSIDAIEHMLMINRVLANVAWCWKINRDKRNGVYAQFENSGDDRDPNFKMVL